MWKNNRREDVFVGQKKVRENTNLSLLFMVCLPFTDHPFTGLFYRRYDDNKLGI
jgi:hypothetical protein